MNEIEGNLTRSDINGWTRVFNSLLETDSGMRTFCSIVSTDYLMKKH
jgi:hypothetical protein